MRHYLLMFGVIFSGMAPADIAISKERIQKDMEQTMKKSRFFNIHDVDSPEIYSSFFVDVLSDYDMCIPILQSIKNTNNIDENMMKILINMGKSQGSSETGYFAALSNNFTLIQREFV